MGSEYMGPLPDPDQYRPPSIYTSSTEPLKEETTTRNSHDAEPAYREHVSGSLASHPADAPFFRPAYVPYAQPAQPPYQQGYTGQGHHPANYGSYQQQPYMYGNSYAPYPGYPGHSPYYSPAYGYYSAPAPPRRDRYLLVMAIISFIGSILALLGGCICLIFLLFISIFPPTGTLPSNQYFGAIVQFVALALAGLLSGGFGLYHSIRSLFLKKPSADFKLPIFWIFLLLYVGVLIIESILRSEKQAVANTPLAVLLVLLAGFLPAMAVLALGVRRVHFPRGARWSTSWRRLTLAIVSGATLAIVVAGTAEVLLVAFVTIVLKVRGFSITNIDQPVPQDIRTVGFVLLVVSVIAPLVEEAVKPLAVVVMIGRMRSAAEAFVLGLACGIGFDLIETSGYIAMGYRDWFDVALQRSSAGLLHGFGAGMVALGWYYFTHPKSSQHRILLACGCWVYAVLQHAIWNGSSVLQILPAPIGPFLNSGTVTLGLLSFPAFGLVFVAESLIMLIFFVYVTGRLRWQGTWTPPRSLSVPAPSFASPEGPTHVTVQSGHRFE